MTSYPWYVLGRIIAVESSINMLVDWDQRSRRHLTLPRLAQKKERDELLKSRARVALPDQVSVHSRCEKSRA
jgi:glycosyltransferase A (GT-A) superfamily protein (DUF2064 family)